MGIESWWSLFRQHSVDPVYVDLKKKVSGRRPVVAMDASIYIWLRRIFEESIVRSYDRTGINTSTIVRY